MRRVAINAFGGPEKLVVEATAGDPQPGHGELLINVEAAGVNYLDVYQRKGGGLHPVPLPFTPGLEGVGRIRAAGEGVAADAHAIGQRVAWINVAGSYADRLLVPTAQAIVVPDAFAPPQCLLFQALTAQYMAHEYRRIQPGDRVLVHAAAGGVGQILVQWLKHLGAWVVGTTSNEDKATVVRALGADAAINYGSTYEFLDELRPMTGGRGVDLVFDSIGAATFASSLKALARGGMLVSCGMSSGPAPAVNPGDLTVMSLRLAGGSVFAYTSDPEELQRRAADVLAGIREGWLRIDDGTAFDLDHAADAHRALEQRKTTGKLFLMT